jgi:hypothetical protein
MSLFIVDRGFNQSLPRGGVSISGTIHNSNTLDAFKSQDINAIADSVANEVTLMAHLMKAVHFVA